MVRELKTPPSITHWENTCQWVLLQAEIRLLQESIRWAIRHLALCFWLQPYVTLPTVYRDSESLAVNGMLDCTDADFTA